MPETTREHLIVEQFSTIDDRVRVQVSGGGSADAHFPPMLTGYSHAQMNMHTCSENTLNSEAIK